MAVKNTENAIEVVDIRKSFYLPNHKNDSLKQAITQAFKKKEKGGNTFNALDGVSFDIKKGDFFGILGRNGSGKSTLLKIISEIYQPTNGTVRHDGKIVSFIELGVGFKSELSGRENVFLNGALLGFSREEIAEMYDEIVAFAELEKFMDQKLKNYSSGMKVRLAFSVAIRAKSDILILDEVLAVGDAAFQKKCYDYFGTLKDTGKTVILVTHSMGNVRKFCNKAVVIDDGQVIFNGEADAAADRYLELFEGDREASLEKSTDGVDLNITVRDKFIDFNISAVSKELLRNPVVALLLTHKGQVIYRWVSDERNISIGDVDVGERLALRVSIQNILPVGKFDTIVSIKSGDRSVVYGEVDVKNAFSIANNASYKHDILWRLDSQAEIEL